MSLGTCGTMCGEEILYVNILQPCLTLLFIQITMPPQNITFPQNKLDVAAENNAASNHSSASVASTHKNIECSENNSETHVSFAYARHLNFTETV